MTKYIVRASVLASIEVEANTPFDAKMQAVEDRDFDFQINNAEHSYEIYVKGDEPVQLELEPSTAEALTGILGEYLANTEDSEVHRVYESLTKYLQGATQG